MSLRRGIVFPFVKGQAVRLLLGTILCALMIDRASAQQMAPDEMVRSVVNEVLESVGSDPTIQSGDTERAIEVLDAKALQHFDFDRMTALAVGKAWHRATPAQMAALATEFKALLVLTYAAALTAYKDQRVSFVPLTMTGDETEVTVQSRIEQAGARPISIDYDLERTGATWKVYDVTIDGIGLVVNFRCQFAQEVRRNGIDGLIDTLHAKNQRPGKHR